MRKKILFFICTPDSNSFGEATQARLFAQQLPKDEYECFFAIHDEINKYIENFNFRTISYKDIQQYKFDLVIISDLIHFIGKSTKILSNKPLEPYEEDIIKAYLYLLSLNINIAFLDITGFYLQNKGLNKKNSGVRECILENLCLKFLTNKCKTCVPPKLTHIHICPINDPSAKITDTHVNQYFWSFPHIKKDKIHLTKESDSSKTIFLVNTVWQYEKHKKKGAGIYYFILEKLLIHYFLQLEERTNSYPLKLVIASPCRFYYPLKIKNLEFQPIYYSSGQPIPNELFESLIFDSDLILTDNIMQNSYHRALLNGIMGVNIKNNLPKIQNQDGFFTTKPDFNLTDTASEAFDLLEYTKPLISSKINITSRKNDSYNDEINHFYKLIKSVELFDEELVLNILHKALFDSEYKTECLNNLESYINIISDLPKADNIVENIFADS